LSILQENPEEKWPNKNENILACINQNMEFEAQLISLAICLSMFWFVFHFPL
jgi:hypothetical protein